MQIFDYDNILLLPRKCRVESRSECDASVTLGGRSFRIPVVPANMKTVVDETISLWLAQNGYFHVLHRFHLEDVAFVKYVRAEDAFASISLGVSRRTATRSTKWSRPAWCRKTSRSTACAARRYGEEDDRLSHGQAACIFKPDQQGRVSTPLRRPDRPAQFGRHWGD